MLGYLNKIISRSSHGKKGYYLELSCEVWTNRSIGMGRFVGTLSLYFNTSQGVP